jgi:ABC-type glycerol-3-phosphate transport system substrate-binding protein
MSRSRSILVIGALLVAAACGACSGSGTAASSGASSDSPSGPLTIVGWGGISDQASELFAKSFTESTGIQVDFQDNPGGQVAAIEAQNAAGQIKWDVADAIDQDQMLELAQKGLLQRLPASVTAKLQALMPGSVEPWGIKYGTLSNVIACNADMVTHCPTLLVRPAGCAHDGRPGQRSITSPHLPDQH